MSGPHDADMDGPTQLNDGPPLQADALVQARAAAVPEPLPRGTALGRYLLLERLGTGGMGEVYAAFDSQLNRKVALKLLLPSPELGTPEEAKLRLLREAQAMAQLTHPSVVPVYDVGELGERIFLAMELVEGRTLRRWLKEAPRPWREVVRVFTEAGRGLAAAHAVGLVHRDFKPDNVLIGHNGRVYVVDFGLACPDAAAPGLVALSDAASEELTLPVLPALALPALSAAGAGDGERSPTDSGRMPTGRTPSGPSSLLEVHVTQMGAALGTPEYMPAEQLRGEALDARADQFSFCVSLYAALHGELPFPGEDSNARMHAMLEGRVQPAPRGSPVPGWLRQVVLKGLSVSREGRFASMEALLSALVRDPGVRQRRLALVAGVVLTLMGAGTVAAEHMRRHGHQCESGEDALLAGVWDAALQQRMERAFRASGAPSAQDAWERVQRALGTRSAELVTAQRAACEDTRVRRLASEKVLALRTACLQRRRSELEAMADVLSHADVRVVEQAAQAVAGLPGVRECADLDSLTRMLAPPEEGKRQLVERVRAQLARVRALGLAGRSREALEAAQAADVQAREVGDLPLRAEALQQLGLLLLTTGERKAAETTLKRAIWTAETARHDEMRFLAATWLAELVSREDGRAEAAHDWVEYALAILHRMRRDETAAGPLYATRGAIQLARGQDEEAEASLRQALALLDAAPDPFEAGQVRVRLASVVSRKGRGEEAVRIMQEAVAQLEQAYGPAHPRVAVALNDLSVLLTGAWRHDEALAPMQRAVSILESTLPRRDADLQISFNHLGSILANLGRHEEALAALQRSLELAEARHEPEVSKMGLAHANIGDVLMDAGRLEEAAPRVLHAVEVLEPGAARLHPDSLSLALMRLGKLHVLQRRPQAAVAPLERALRVHAAARSRGHYTGEARLWLARALWASKQDVARARQLAQLAREEYLGAGGARALADADRVLREGGMPAENLARR